MIRKIIHIDEDKCVGCGACAGACQEGAIAMVNGKARLTRDDYCDGLGNCLPACPTGAISFEEREAAAYDHEAVQRAMARNAASQLRQWPVQIRLVPAKAPFFDRANLLVAADCTAYAYAAFHQDFIRGRATIIGCPKLDDEDYTAKLQAIIQENEVKSLTIVRMEVPCCSGLERAASTALKNSGKFIPWQVVVISTEGQILES